MAWRPHRRFSLLCSDFTIHSTVSTVKWCNRYISHGNSLLISLCGDIIIKTARATWDNPSSHRTQHRSPGFFAFTALRCPIHITFTACDTRMRMKRCAQPRARALAVSSLTQTAPRPSLLHASPGHKRVMHRIGGHAGTLLPSRSLGSCCISAHRAVISWKPSSMQSKEHALVE